MTDQDIKRLIDSAAATVQAYPANLAWVRKRATTMRRRRTLAVATAFVLLAGAAVPVWLSATKRESSMSDTVTSSVQPMVFSPAYLNAFANLEQFDPGWLTAQIRPDRTIAGYSLRSNGLEVEGPLVLSQQGDSVVAVGKHTLPGLREGGRCANAEEFVVIGDLSGNEIRRERLPQTCDLSMVIGADTDSVYLRRGRDDIIVFDLATGQTHPLLTMSHPMNQVFASGTVAVVEPAGGPFVDGTPVPCTSDGWNIRTLRVDTGEHQTNRHPGSPCDAVKGLSVSPDGTHVAFIQEHDQTARAFVINISTGRTVVSREIGGPHRSAEIFGIVFADNKTAWAAWLPTLPPGPPQRLADIIQFATIPLNG